MKKFLSAILIFCFLLTVTSGVSFAAKSNITELPDLKIIMDGKITPYKDVPICVGQNTLLPLRELLVNLGVPDDTEHILYDDILKSVTVIKDQTKLVMTVGDKTAYVNDKPVQLSVAPVGYDKNQRIYIPFRFVAEELGKKVVWDGPDNAVLVCDAEKFDSNKQILEKSNEAMNQLTKCRMNLALDGTIKTDNISMKLGIQADTQINKAQKSMYMKMSLNMLGMDIDMESYYSKNASYTFEPFSNNWQKTTYLPAEYDKLFTGQSDTNMLEVNDLLCAGLTRAEDSKPGEILLKGDLILRQLFQKAMQQQNSIENSVGDSIGDPADSIEKAKFDKSYVEISIDSETDFINSIALKTSYSEISGKTNIQTDLDLQIQYCDYNGNFEITVPEEALKNAVETKSGKALLH